MPTFSVVNLKHLTHLTRLLFLATALLAVAAPARAQSIEAALAAQIEGLAVEAARAIAAPGLRVQVRVGHLNPRLRLAPCAEVQPYLPTGTRLWGTARIGLRCNDAGVRWNVYLPIHIDVFGPALVASTPLVAGHVLAADDLRVAEVNLAATPSAPVTQQQLAVGRMLARPLGAGAALHDRDLRARQWFAAGDSVRLVATGRGWRISGEGQALAAGVEGQSVRVRTESGRVISGVAVAERLVEVAL